MTNVWIHGLTGRMGKILKPMCGDKFIGGSGSMVYEPETAPMTQLSRYLAPADAIIDFSSRDGSMTLVDALDVGKDVLVASTGLSPKDMDRWKAYQEAFQVRVLLSPNTSIGILVLRQALKLVEQSLPAGAFDRHILESHHKGKLDAPSGTALALKSMLKDNENVHVHAIRGGNVFGYHEVQYLGEMEELGLYHRALTRDLFASGALRLVSWLTAQDIGFYTLDDVSL